MIIIIRIGEFNKLRINNFTSIGAYLDAETSNRSDNILLPRKQLPSDVQIGDYLKVFIYKDSEDRLIATIREPLAKVGDLVCLKASAKTTLGTFMDFGLERGLFLPFSEQKYLIEVGRSYLVYVYLDKSLRLCCTTDVYKYLKTDSPYQKGDMVAGTVYQIRREIGAFVAVDHTYKGLIPRSELYQNLRNGDQIRARVLRVREDGKLDLSIREPAHKQMDIDAETLLQDMKNNLGCLPLTEDAGPKEIEVRYQMSKAAFKRAVGALLKAKKIIKEDGRLKLV
ncbi:RNA binding S1 domain protein [Syntrophobotulus glycolicus DSM 8271]|uniref:RNA binding S1 domain protein n=1 Tax=Syntrophobotulus glycolicus (strain DSM 8271 / FlGlyR) TaxID=645991 RepID=F0T1H3_SYNGF|nr:RNA binding S1 domain protein [Syntrophobotulus glycolicus DSM 8271]